MSAGIGVPSGRSGLFESIADKKKLKDLTFEKS